MIIKRASSINPEAKYVTELLTDLSNLTLFRARWHPKLITNIHFAFKLDDFFLRVFFLSFVSVDAGEVAFDRDEFLDFSVDLVGVDFPPPPPPPLPAPLPPREPGVASRTDFFTPPFSPAAADVERRKIDAPSADVTDSLDKVAAAAAAAAADAASESTSSLALSSA